MELHFRNRYVSRVWVAVMFYSPVTCRDHGQWGTRGWWAIDPGGEAFVLNTDNRYAAFYAEAANGAVWTGPYGPMYVYQTAFDSCLNIGSTAARRVGTRLVDMNGYSRYYVNLVA
ncbi:DUF1036 domain-containing protein [Streptosporangium pseudovulgare]|uniref:DUF1036 domain-containing protein n=1 Tax=Streptosporangium pseudovulgare TaxID=35765 RepID=A0ABQ2QR71_9ACTN|nr:DUF1036 domain-containing protein [Streptosporangium pseudovulgare]GGP90308.1 hypothetical protein GCM10010140_19990 [Streptosporangium pseudovulgare]